MRHSRITALSAVFTVAALAPMALGQDAPPAQKSPGDGGQGGGQGGGQRGGQGGGQGGGQQREGGQGGGGRGGQQAGGGAASLEASMKAMNRTLKSLNGLVADPAKKAEALAAVSEAQRACAACKVAPLPAKFTEKAPDAEGKAKIEAEYRSDLRKNLRMLLDLEDAIVAGKADEAKAILAKIEELRDHAHEEMGVDD